jgi:hypothetical protein
VSIYVSLGTQVRCTVQFLDFVGALTSPTTVVLTLRSPTGVVTTPSVTQDATGTYHADVTADLEGVWSLGWTGTGALTAAVEDSIQVRD